MIAVIVIYALLFSVQRTIAYFASDYQNLNIALQQIFGVFLPVFVYYKTKGEKYISKSDLKAKSPVLAVLSLMSGMLMQISGSFLNFFPVYFLENTNIPAPKGFSLPEGIGMLGYIIAVCLMPAVTEEVLFRKFTYDKFSKYGKMRAVFFTALIFGISHLDLYSFVPLTVVGLILSCIVYEGFPLIYAMIFHFAFNISGVILQKLTMLESVNELLNNYFVPLGALSCVFEILFILYLRGLRRKINKW